MITCVILIFVHSQWISRLISSLTPWFVPPQNVHKTLMKALVVVGQKGTLKHNGQATFRDSSSLLFFHLVSLLVGLEYSPKATASLVDGLVLTQRKARMFLLFFDRVCCPDI